MECLWLWHVPQLIMECLWLWYVPQLVMAMFMVVVCSTIGYGNGYGCGMFHICYGMVTVVMEWIWSWYVPRLQWYGCGMFHQGWLTRGVVATAPSLVTQLSGALCGNALTSWMLKQLIHFDLVVRRHGSIWGFGSWRMVGGHIICLIIGTVPHG